MHAAKTLLILLVSLMVARTPHSQEANQFDDDSETRKPCSWSTRWKEPRSRKPAAISHKLKMPKKVKDAHPEWPDTKTWHSGAPVVEAIIEPDGSVKEVKLIRGFEPSWPQAEEAIKKAIKKWHYEPVVIDGEPVPVCMTAVINVNWQ